MSSKLDEFTNVAKELDEIDARVSMHPSKQSCIINEINVQNDPPEASKEPHVKAFSNRMGKYIDQSMPLLKDLNTNVKAKKKVVMVSPSSANSLFPDLDSCTSKEINKLKPTDINTKRSLAGILKRNTRIPLDFKKDHMGVLYSPILESKHASVALEMERKDAERYGRWDEMIASNAQGWDSSWEDRIWKGVPHAYRKTVWSEMVTRNSGFYSSLSKDQKKWVNMEILKKYKDIKSWDLSESSFAPEIHRDVQNTLPRLITFQGSEGKHILDNLLKVISIHNFQIGYVNGLNSIVGLLMTIYADDMTFFFLQKLLYDKPRRDSFSSFYGLSLLYQKDEYFFDCTIFIHSRILNLWFPKLEERLIKYGISPKLYLRKWLFSLFAGCSAVSYPLSFYKNSNGGILSWPTILRIWDVYLFYGWDVVIIVTIAILNYYSKEMLNMDPTTLMVFFGIEDGSMEVHGVATDSLPFISNPDRFMDIVHNLFHVGKRNRLSILGDYHSSSRNSTDSISSISSDSKTLRGMSGKQLVNFFKSNFIN